MTRKEIRALIIDDEELARSIIRSYLHGHADIEIIGECANGFEGLKAIQEMSPDLLFLDIQMPKINGFELLELIEVPPVTIFSTAYDQYAIKAFENNAVDYLLKPYSQDRFDDALEKARLRIKEEPTLKNKELLEEGLGEEISRIVVRTGSRIDVIDISTISHIEAQDDYVEIHSEKGKFLKQMTMKYLEEHLPKGEFVRSHRSHIISVSHLVKIEHFEKDSYLALLESGEKVPISRAGYGRLREILNF